MAAEFASLDGMGGNIPTSGASADRLQLTTPNSMITGTMAGLQQIGSPSLTVDSVKNLITVKPISTANTQILRFGQVATGFLGMAVNDGINDTMFAGQDNTGATVVKIAKSGFDAKTATGNNLIFNSSQDVLKVVSPPFNISVTASNGSQFVSNSVAHGLTFTPALLAYIQVPSSLSGNNPAINHNNPALIYGLVASVFRVFALAEVTVDATNVTIAAQTDGSVGAGTYTWTAKVYLLQETFS